MEFSVPTVADMVERVPRAWSLVDARDDAMTWIIARRLCVTVAVRGTPERNGCWLHTIIACVDQRKLPSREDVLSVMNVVYEDRFCFQVWAPSKAHRFNEAIHLVERIDQPTVPEVLWNHSGTEGGIDGFKVEGPGR